MDKSSLDYVRSRINHKSSNGEKLYAVATKITQTRVSYLFASSPQNAATKWSEGAELNYEYLPDEEQRCEVVTVIDEDGAEHVISASRNPREHRRRDIPEFEL